MAFRYFYSLCVILLFVAIIQVNADEEIEYDTEGRAGALNPTVKAIVRYLANLFKGVTVSCLNEAAQNCIQHWKQPSEAATCAKNFFKANQGRCAFNG